MRLRKPDRKKERNTEREKERKRERDGKEVEKNSNGPVGGEGAGFHLIGWKDLLCGYISIYLSCPPSSAPGCE